MLQGEHVRPLVDEEVDALFLHLKVVAAAPPDHAEHKEPLLALAVPHQERSVTRALALKQFWNTRRQTKKLDFSYVAA